MQILEVALAKKREFKSGRGSWQSNCSNLAPGVFNCLSRFFQPNLSQDGVEDTYSADVRGNRTEPNEPDGPDRPKDVIAPGDIVQIGILEKPNMWKRENMWKTCSVF